MRWHLSGLAVALVFAIGCGGEERGTTSSSSGSGDPPGTSSGDTTGGATDEADAGTSGGAREQAIGAPELTEVAKMHGSLHVFWKLPADTACVAIEGERKTEATSFALAWTVDGDETDKHDMAASEDATYTYRLRCKVGSDYSDYSNEMGRNPTK
jgi:hypothetical protein